MCYLHCSVSWAAVDNDSRLVTTLGKGKTILQMKRQTSVQDHLECNTRRLGKKNQRNKRDKPHFWWMKDQWKIQSTPFYVCHHLQCPHHSYQKKSHLDFMARRETAEFKATQGHHVWISQRLTRNETSNNSSLWYSIIRKRSTTLRSIIQMRLRPVESESHYDVWTKPNTAPRSHNPISRINLSRKGETFVEKVGLSKFSLKNIFHFLTEFLVPQFFICLQ